MANNKAKAAKAEQAADLPQTAEAAPAAEPAPATEPTQQADAHQERQPARYVVTSSRGLNLRLAPGMMEPVLWVLPGGAEVTFDAGCTETVPGWTPVVTPVGCGWVKSEFIREV